MTKIKVGMKPAEEENAYQSMQLRMHPRVFAALGRDLVTNDVVAVIELVKNSYDAFAQNVWVEFGQDDLEGEYLEIRDDGSGMTRDVIENQWCLVATPNKESNSIVCKDGKARRVSGSKGLGRLSVARLGNRLTMLTQGSQSPCWEVKVDWADISRSETLSQSTISLREHLSSSPFIESGTRLRIYDLAEQWDDRRKTELNDNLSRLISPFSTGDEFNIFLSASGGTRQVSVESTPFLTEPKYSIKGEVDAKGNVACTYQYSPIGAKGAGKTAEIKLAWPQISRAPQSRSRWRFPHSDKAANCGPFSFEIRAWDIDADSIGEISDRYNFGRRSVRSAIRSHKGISVYRDGILVLPKSERGLDWLGLDLLRVSQIGRRLSTNQIVGYISISSESNPRIEDTSDRERLSVCPEVEEFEEIIKSIVRLLGNRRNEDRVQPDRELPMFDLFATLSAEQLVESASELAQTGARASAVVPLIRRFDESLSRNRETIKRRFEYYSRLATVGTIAHMLVHEIRNRTTVLGRLLETIKREYAPFRRDSMRDLHSRAEKAVSDFERLADTFLPLASRNYRRRRRSILEDRIRSCLALRQNDIDGLLIECQFPATETPVNIDPAELDSVILNLVMNATYWLGAVERGKRQLHFDLEMLDGEERVTVWVHDNGPGIDEADLERVFWPGVTRKPDGIGMGLTVASELVAVHGGQMRTMHPGLLGGASFAFDIPRAKNGAGRTDDKNTVR